MRYTIEVSEEEARVIEKALDLYSRVLCGNIQEVASVISVTDYPEKCFNDLISRNTYFSRGYLAKAENLLFLDKKMGIISQSTPIVAIQAYAVQKELQKAISPKGTWADGIWFDYGSEHPKVTKQ